MKKLILSLFLSASIVIGGFSQSLPNTATPSHSSSTSTAYVFNISSYGTSYNDKIAFVKFLIDNTGASTVNINGIGIKSLRIKSSGIWIPLIAGDLSDSVIAFLKYDQASGYMRVVDMFRAGGGGSGTVQSVTGDGVDNTDPANPVLTFPIASEVDNAPSGNIAATNVQTAINELDTEKQASLVSGTNIKTVNSNSLVGSGDVSVGTVTSVTSANSDATVANTTSTPTITIVSAPKWTTVRTLAITGDLSYTSPSIDGSGNVTAAGTLATVNSNTGSFGSATQVGTFTVNGKGLITAAGNTTVTPAVGSITGLGTGVSTALGVNVGSSGAFVVNGGALGTPSSGVATNLTGTASGLTAGTVTTNANLTGDVTSSGNATTYNNNVPLTKGGLEASLTASNGGIFYSTGSAGAILAGTATANKLLVSGASGAPSWSTPTFPNASATSGKTIRSDGTNWIASTATLSDAPSTTLKWLRSDGTNWITSTSTLAEGGVTTGKILKSDGTNWVASTETYAAPGTSGNVMTSDGTNWTSAAGSFYTLASGGTATGTNTFTFNTANQLNVAGTFTTTANNQFLGQFGGTHTIRSTASERFDSYLFNPVINTSLTSQSAAGVTIAATFGATGAVNKSALRVIEPNTGNSVGLELVLKGGGSGSKGFRIWDGTNDFLTVTSQSKLTMGSATAAPTIGPSTASGSTSFTQAGTSWLVLNNISSFGGSDYSVATLHYATSVNQASAGSVTSILDLGASGATTFNPTAQSTDFIGLRIGATINQTSSATGNIYGIKYNPTLTAVLGTHYAFVSSAGRHGFATLTPNSIAHVNGSFATAYVAKTANYTMTISDYTVECTSGTFNVTLPTAVGITGRIYTIVNSGAGTITIDTTSSQTFVNVTATPTTLTMATVGTVVVQSNGANWMRISNL